MGYLTEVCIDIAPYPTSRRGGQGELGVLLFEVDKLAEKGIEFIVADKGSVVDIIFVVIVVNEPCEFFHTLAGAVGGRG